MDTGDWIGLLGGIAGIVAAFASIRALKRADEANRLSGTANRIATESRNVAIEANRLSGSANTLSEESNVIAREAVEISREALHYQRESDRQSGAAMVVLSSNNGRALWVYTTTDGYAKIGVRPRNEGKAIARDVKMEVYRNGEPSAIEVGSIRKLEDEPVMFLFYAFWREGKLPIEDDVYELKFSYRDDLDMHTFSRCFRFTGGACPDWTAVEVNCS